VSEYFGTAETSENCIDNESESSKLAITQLKIHRISVSYLKSNSMKQNLHWQPNSYSTRQEIRRLLVTTDSCPSCPCSQEPVTHRSPRSCLTPDNMAFIYSEELLGSHTNKNLEDHLFLAVSNCLFNTLVAALQIGRLSPPSATWETEMPWWQRTHLI
jgi:hypothetical protein